MIDGHGDDAYKYGQKIRINFSSNVYNHVNHNGLREHLYHRMESIRSYPEPELINNIVKYWMANSPLLRAPSLTG